MADLAARHLGAGVVAASDDAFGPKELLLSPGPVSFVPGVFDHKGEVVDGWETRRRRSSGHDWAVVRLGTPGIVQSVDVDTTSFAGNAPSTCWLEACGAEGHPAPDELGDWQVIVPRTRLAADAHNVLLVDDPRRWTHVRLCVEPDGGVGRLRVHGEPVPDPRLLDGLTVDLAGQELGGSVVSATDTFYTSADALIRPDRPRTMGEGWETRRRRDGKHDSVVLRLAAAGLPRLVEVDTTHFVYNASAFCELWSSDDGVTWAPLLGRVALQPDTRHRFLASGAPATHLRLDAFPDGGLARVRVLGPLTAQGRFGLGLRWLNTLPEEQLLSVVPSKVVEPLLAARPLVGDDVDAVLASVARSLADVLRPLLAG